MITEGAGVPIALLKERGVDLEKLREDLLDALDAPSELRATYLSQRTAVERERARRPRATS